MSSLITALSHCPIIPVVTLQHADDVIALSEALLSGGITTIEITLRTDAGIHAIEKLAHAHLPICVGAGTIASPQQLRDVVQAGASFAISPFCSEDILDEAAKHPALTYLPGVVTPSEIATALAAGCRLQKFFPAAAFGGVTTLKQYASVFPDVRFCPTGGITHENVKQFLALPNVACVGGTWLAPTDAVSSHDWDRISTIAKLSVKALA